MQFESSGKLFLSLGLAVIVLVTVVAFRSQETFFAPTERKTTIGVTLPASPNKETTAIEVIAENLVIPWEIVFLPDGDLLVTERSGRLVRIGEREETIPLGGVEHTGEGGLLGLALHPNFAQNRQLYLYLTTEAGDGLINRVERYELRDNTLSNKTTIIDSIPGARFHDGGRIAFGPDGKLYITTGDAGKPTTAQDLNDLGGKVLRLNDDGTIPTDNPFSTAVYSLGHRNSQGLAWDDAGNLWSTEHGRSGVQSGFDELNLIIPGGNYGWPLLQGDEAREGFASPVIHSGPDETWAPAGMAFFENSIFFTGLRGEVLYEARLDNREVASFVAHFPEEFGRLRVVRLGPDGFLYIATSNQDGRGIVRAGDDKIIRVDPSILER